MERTEFQEKRTPKELLDYFELNYSVITNDPEIREKARLRKEPFKTFIEELRPLCIFCYHRFANYNDIRCCLSEPNAPYDALVYFKDKVLKLEITWPIDGKKLHKQMQMLNERGFDFENRGYIDTESHENLIQIVKDTVAKKQLRDYSNTEGSILLIAIDDFEFETSNNKHMELLNELIRKLSEFEFQVSEVSLVFMQSKQIFKVKSSLAV